MTQPRFASNVKLGFGIGLGIMGAVMLTALLLSLLQQPQPEQPLTTDLQGRVRPQALQPLQAQKPAVVAPLAGAGHRCGTAWAR